MKTTKKLFVNVGLAFVAGFSTALGTLLATTPKDTALSVVIASIGGLVYAGIRAAVGALALNVKQVPSISVDE